MKSQLEHAPPHRELHATRDAARTTATPALESLGNSALLALLRSGRLQRKARVVQPDDPLEREADRAANAVASNTTSLASVEAQRFSPECRSYLGGRSGS